MKEIGLQTEGQVNIWKKKYGKVKLVKIKDGEKEYYAYLRRPDMKTMRVCAALEKEGKSFDKSFESAEVLVKNCLLNKNEEREKMMEDAVLFTQIATALQGFFGETQAEIKNL